MALLIDGFESDIIVDEAIIANKREYLIEKLELSRIKELLVYFLDEVLENIPRKVDFNHALGSTLNIGKLLAIAPRKNSECRKLINSVTLSEEDLFKKLADILFLDYFDIRSEVEGEDLYSLVPEFVMTEFSYVKLMIMRHNKAKLQKLNIDMHKVGRVLEAFLNRYEEHLKVQDYICIIDVNGLYALGNHFMALLIQCLEKEKSGEAQYSNNQLETRLIDVFNDTQAKTIDIMMVIMGIKSIKNFCTEPIRKQLESSEPYKYRPEELIELERISDRIFNIAFNSYENQHEPDAESQYLKDRTLKNIEIIRSIIKEKYTDINKRGVALNCDDVDIYADRVVGEIKSDLGFICGDSNSLSKRMRKYIGQI